MFALPKLLPSERAIVNGNGELTELCNDCEAMRRRLRRWDAAGQLGRSVGTLQNAAGQLGRSVGTQRMDVAGRWDAA